MTNRERDGIIQYAQKFASDEGRRNGLYWKAAEGEVPSPLGPLAAEAAAEGYRRASDKPTPYHGYYYKILKGQGKMRREGCTAKIVLWPMEGTENVKSRHFLHPFAFFNIVHIDNTTFGASVPKPG